jgi:hypothetical protein
LKKCFMKQLFIAMEITYVLNLQIFFLKRNETLTVWVPECVSEYAAKYADDVSVYKTYSTAVWTPLSCELVMPLKRIPA